MRWILSLTSIALLSACQQPIRPGPLPVPERYLTCADAPENPAVEPLEAFALPSGILAYPKAETDARDSLIARYVVALRAAHASCAGRLEQVRIYVREAGE